MLKVLIVEDEDVIRRGLVYTIDWLSMDWMVIGSAANGKEGLKLIREHNPDLVITDVIMPVMSGIEMLEMAKNENLPSFKSIILTSYAEFEYARQAVKLDAYDYLLKPIDEDEFKRIIQEVKDSIEMSNLAIDYKSKLEIDEILNFNFYINGDTIQNSYVKEALYRIRDCYHDKLSIEVIADELNVSSSYLSRKFKEATSQTFLEFLTKYRIQKAIYLLKQGKYRVYEVSDMTGFNDYKHFCTVFKKYTQTSPKEFIKNIGSVIQC